MAGAEMFHFATGLCMAMVYAHFLEPAVTGSPAFKGIAYAVVTWILNAALVLPLVGDGFAGVDRIGAVGVVAFAFCHTLFFVFMAVMYSHLRRRPLPRGLCSH